MIEFLSKPWPWYIGGPLIAVVMYTMLYLGKTFGVSSAFRTICSAGGAKKISDWFNFDWKKQQWNLLFVFGIILGGFLAGTVFSNPDPVQISTQTLENLTALNIGAPTNSLAPMEMFSWEAMMRGPGLIFVLLGGFMVGFGTLYAGGCTSGHAITGLSFFQRPSLVAVIGFFVGGLAIVHLVLPAIL